MHKAPGFPKLSKLFPIRFTMWLITMEVYLSDVVVELLPIRKTRIMFTGSTFKEIIMLFLKLNKISIISLARASSNSINSITFIYSKADLFQFSKWQKFHLIPSCFDAIPFLYCFVVFNLLGSCLCGGFLLGRCLRGSFSFCFGMI